MQNFWDGFCVFDLKTLCITFHLRYNNVSCICRCVFTLLQTCVLVGLDWVVPMMQLLLHVTFYAFSCIHTSYSIHFHIILLLGSFLIVSFSLSLSSVYVSVLLWHPNANLLRPGTLFVLGHPLLLILHLFLFSSIMRRPKQTSLRTSLDEAFIRNAKSFCQTSPTLSFPLSFIVGDGSQCVTSRSLVHPC